MDEHKLSRRAALKIGAGAAALAGLPWMNSSAFAADELRAGIAGFNVINTLDPAKASLVPEFLVIYGAFNGLLKFNEKMEIVPDLAESYTVVDPTTTEFKLRKGVKFHDGGEMTAEDVKFSIERLMDEKFASPNRGKVTAISAVTVVDPYTVRITTKAPYAPLLNYLTNTRTGTQIVSRKAVEAAGAEGFGRKPVGTGAFMVKDWKSNESVDMVAFDGYFGGKPAIRSVKIPIIAEESSGMTAILGNQIDLTSTAPFADVPGLEKRTAEVTVLKQPGLNTRYFALNVKKAPFDDVHFRRAVSMAFDRNVLVKAAIFGEGVAIPGVLPPSLWPEGKGFTSEYTTFNPAKAKEEMAKSKYGAGTEATVIIWGSNWWRRTGEIMVGMVNQTLGTKFQLQAMEFNAAFAKAKAGDYDALVFGWLGLVDADEYLGEILGSKGFRNIQGYSSPKMDALLEKARSEMDPAKRRQVYREADMLAIEDMPVLPCFCSNVHNLVRPNVKGFSQLPYSNFADQFAKMTVG
ncbi:diguanylate phosphodiesterase [Alsobacter metallidurans]|uniref:Diguanylate phosphodiesterase n=1 Tax=Alsobacter metallidurans TaxID=340221 RepID=A0A917I5E2_9HYPH|nr:ABC transporter substrate-binding protein [Alsobacter metallidurans]GGH16468.1 diguanylate phosphodiesterase [Alsobacter metallidurans]